MMNSNKTSKTFKKWSFLALLPLALFLMNFTSTVVELNRMDAYELSMEGDPVDAKAIETAIAPFLERLVADRNDTQALSFLHKTLVHFSYKYPEDKAGLETAVKSILKKYNAPVEASYKGEDQFLSVAIASE